jgi:hypothetical protein
MDIPLELREFPCQEYFASARFTDGVFDEEAQIDLVYPAHELRKDKEHEFLAIGRPGVDGIEFVFRAGHEGVWAFYPIGREFVRVAPSISSLLSGWDDGSITV